jgi:hypothetical protein
VVNLAAPNLHPSAPPVERSDKLRFGVNDAITLFNLDRRFAFATSRYGLNFIAVGVVAKRPKTAALDENAAFCPTASS